MSAPVTFTQKARQAHGPECPDWILILAGACDDAGTVRPVSTRIGYSHSAVSSVINGSYPGNTDKLRNAVVSIYMTGAVKCPVLGTIDAEKCLNIQRRKSLKAAAPHDVKLWKACRSGCPNSGVKS